MLRTTLFGSLVCSCALLFVTGCDEETTFVDSGSPGIDAGGGTDAGMMMAMDAGGGADAGPGDAGGETDAGEDTDGGDGTDAGMDAAMMMTDAGTDAGGADAGSDAGAPACTPDMDIAMAIGAAVAMGSTVGAGDDSASATCGSSGGNDIAISWTAPADGEYVVSTEGSDFDTVLHVRAGADCAGTEVTCNDDGGSGLQSVASFTATAGDTFTFVVDGYDGADEGDYVLNIVQLVCPDGDLGSMTGDAVSMGTTAGAGDATAPTACGSTGAEDIAFTWTAPSTGMWTFDTFGSAFDTVLHVHTGSSCGAADETACGDDFSSLQSRVDVMLTSGDMVTIVVDGFGTGDVGDYVLSINPTPTVTDEVGACDDGTDNDRDGAADCLDADCFGYTVCLEICDDTADNDGDGDVDCMDSDCFTDPACETCPAETASGTGAMVASGDTTGGTGNRLPSCGGSGNDTTVAFTAPTTGSYTFDTMGSSFDTTLSVLIGGCVDGVEIACNNDDTVLSPQSSVTVDLAMGDEVIVVIDGFGGAEGTWQLNVTEAAMTYGAPTTAGDLVINEIMQNPDGAEPDNEWFEVFNSTSSVLNLNGCRFSENMGPNMHIISGDVLIRPGQFFTFAGGASPGFVPDYDYSGSPGAFLLSNGADEIIITCGVTEIDRVEYDGGPMFPDPDGFSMNLDTGAADATMNDSGANWCQAPIPAITPYDGVNVGSPGEANASCPAP